jgi:phospholipid/cholesterol/gamma-HCH transport system permease protein
MPSDLNLADKIVLSLEPDQEEKIHIKAVKNFFNDVARFARFTTRFFKQAVRPPFELSTIVEQCYSLGYKSFPLIATTGFIMGLVFTLQSQPTLASLGAVSWLPSMVGISIVREIGPVIAALIFAGKVGSGIGAEIASMKETEQIDAMEVSGMNPYKYLVVTRIISATLMLPVLVIAADAISLYGSYIGCNLQGDVNFHLFFRQVFGKLAFSDIFPAFIKTFFFGFFIGLIGCYKGYYASKGTEGVGLAANSAVVAGSLAVFIIDMIAVQVAAIFN